MSSSTVIDDWQTASPFGNQDLNEVHDYLISRGFRESIISRGISRIAAVPGVPGTKTWVVQGEAGKGDYYSEYRVTLEGTHYRCSCHSHMFGQRRRRRLCSHILAVIAARRSGQVQ